MGNQITKQPRTNRSLTQKAGGGVADPSLRDGEGILWAGQLVRWMKGVYVLRCLVGCWRFDFIDESCRLCFSSYCGSWKLVRGMGELKDQMANYNE